MSPRLVAFLYLLMRDELPTGKVEALIKEAQGAHEDHRFSGVHLASYARQLAERLS